MALPDALQAANGKWPGILMGLGAPESTFNGKHQPCPLGGCGGEDRFRWIDHRGKGRWICNQCGSGDGMDFAERFLNADFKTAIKEVKKHVNTAPYFDKPDAPKKDAAKIGRKLQKMWNEARKPEMVRDYLLSRGLQEREISGADLRGGNIHHLDKKGNITVRGAVLARVVSSQNRVGALHRTYISPKEKKLTETSRAISGGAIRLITQRSANCTTLMVAEGIETGLSARALWLGRGQEQVHLWITVSASMMKKLAIPDWVEKLVIMGDNDETYTGQAAAYELANRAVAQKKIPTEVHIPKSVGRDWNDVLMEIR